ncbi:MAG: DNA repair protein RadA [Oscillospiraceae bacterium]|nr:DNA repair protein RadA [Oscillospiraceae bacterium]
MKEKTVFFCTECGNESPKWAGRCPSCGAWNALVEQRAEKVKRPSGASRGIPRSVKVTNITEIDTSDEIRFSTGMGELDRVLGGGAVKGSLVLVGGAPGIGKSTLMLQICQQLGMQNKVLYVSGEESIHQLKMRAKRLGVDSANLFVVSETRLSDILEAVEREQPDVLIIDSIQTLYNEELDSPAGGVGQVKDCTMALMNLAKGQGITVFVIGHVNKEGSIAGPKVLEHMVDCVLYFEGDRHMTYRILRAAKNRFGATNEIGVFEMLNEGLKEVENPSEMLLSGRPQDAPGTCVTCVMEGARPVLAEVQALVSSASGVRPLRQSNGFDYNRANMLLAVLEKRGGLKISQCDAYLNIIGGLTLDEPAADLAALVAIASSYLDYPVPSQMAAVGEVGLSGEVRTISHLEQRLSEVRRLGFTQCIVPHHRTGELHAPAGLELLPVRNISDALKLFVRGK